MDTLQLVGQILIFLLGLASAWTLPLDGGGAKAVDDMFMIGEITQWIQANGGTISKKVQVKHISGSLSGLFATENVEAGEVLVIIPWTLILVPFSHKADRCDKAERLRDAVMTKDSKDQNPYERYLATRTREHIPLFWSSKSKEILEELMTDFETRGFSDEMTDVCDDRMLDEGFQQAYMLLQTRGEGYYGDLLIPFEDLLNHRNGNHTNVQPEILAGKYVRIVTTRAVTTGEQYQNSYNKCPSCKALFTNPQLPIGFQVTSQLFEDYGFVESVPQRWVLPEVRMIFDVVQSQTEDADDEDAAVVFAVPPSFRGWYHLRRRLYELAVFEEEYGERSDIPEVELEGIFSMHEAIVDAYSLALYHYSEGYVSEKVWSKDPESWHLETGYQEEIAIDEL
jgi:SET domain